MANRRCLKTLILNLHKSTHNNRPSSFLHHFRTLTHIPNRLPNLYSSNPNFSHYFSITNFDSHYRCFSSDRIDNGNDGSDDDDDEDDDDESDYEDDEGENVENGAVKREYSPEEKEAEAAAIGYKVLGQLQRSDRVFKPYEPVFAIIQIGAHQFKVSNGDCIYTEKLKFCEVHDKLILNKVLMLGSKTQTMIGRPILPEAAVHAVVEEHIPKLLLHRLFPNVRYSLWVDGKLELVVDPYQILERFLWRKNASFAISRHYKRFDVFEEAEANKAASKYDNASIDFQINFYKTEGLTPYSEAKLPIRSDVPEGCVIIREHIPISNLFTCLWFNEVDRFTSRDQISFSTVRDKITSKTNWTVHMFWDCQRRNFVVQGYHRDILEHWPPPPSPLLLSPPPPPPSALAVIMVPPSTPIDEKPKISALETSTEHIVSNPTKVPSIRRRRDRRTGSRRHRKVSVGISQN